MVWTYFSFDENLCLATSQDDPQWASFVYWTAQSLVYAEEHDLEQYQSYEMPLVHAFGPGYVRIFRDTIHYAGNYGDLYASTVAPILPRQGRNRLNLKEDKISPLVYIPPGFAVLDDHDSH